MHPDIGQLVKLRYTTALRICAQQPAELLQVHKVERQDQRKQPERVPEIKRDPLWYPPGDFNCSQRFDTRCTYTKGRKGEQCTNNQAGTKSPGAWCGSFLCLVLRDLLRQFIGGIIHEQGSLTTRRGACCTGSASGRQYQLRLLKQVIGTVVTGVVTGHPQQTKFLVLQLRLHI